jgi:hypothetical protein
MVIKTLNLDNPFADYGNIVEGNRFVGRKSETVTIHNRVLGSNYGNIAIMGLPRIGKSSLAWNALMTEKDELFKRKILVMRINSGSILTSKDFYLKLMDKALPNVRTLSFELYDQLASLRKYYNEHESENEIEFFFALVKQFDYRLIYILDEFDNLANFFKLQDFQLLRELSISPDTKICLVTISRRTIQELEPDNGSISNFYGVFSDLHLKPFSDFDLSDYWEMVENKGIEVSNEYKKEVFYLVGNHPYWIDMMNYNFFNYINSGVNSNVKIFSEIESELKKILWYNYDDIIELMNKEGLKSHFFQAVVGPVMDLSQMSIERLTKYGLIIPILAKRKYGFYFNNLIENGLANENDISYDSISIHLNNYLKQRENEYDIWPLWTEAENKVRNLITIYLKKKFGENWRNPFVNANPKKEADIVDMENKRLKNKKDFGNSASDNLVSYTYPLNLFNCFITTDWTWFQKVLGDNKANWFEKFKLLAKVRNPIAHSNKDFVDSNEQFKASEICKELINKIDNWNND